MLQSLEIDNYALIDRLKINLVSGLNVITGETGAGKSIILGALGLVMGRRADTKVLFDSDRNCVVEAQYNLSDLDLKWFFEENELDYDDELIIRRTINTSGKSRAFINDMPVKLEILQNLNSYILDLHQQFDTMLIQQPVHQRSLLDAFGGHQSLLASYESSYATYKEAQKKLEALQHQDRESGKEMDFIQFQLEELKEANLDGIDQVEMESRLALLNKSEDIIRTYQMVSLQLDGSDKALIDQLLTLAHEADTLVDIKKEFKQFSERLNSVVEELKDLASQAGNISESIDLDQEEANLLQTRLDMLYSLQRKHHVHDVASLVQLRDELQEQVSGYENIDQLIEQQTQIVNDLKAKVTSVGETLRDDRKKAAVSLQKNVSKALDELAMPNAQLVIEILHLPKPASHGLDQITYLFSANKGGNFKPLKDVASGGETSRLALAIKSIMACKSTLPTMVFDEIDSGVSGEIAHKMGLILQELANDHQVLTITHSPQIAAKAKQHFYVYKYDDEERTQTAVRVLSEGERIKEVATMMSGDPPSAAALDAAKELIDMKR
jgi:DNA repair protein RecN (Recombination protein N)